MQIAVSIHVSIHVWTCVRTHVQVDLSVDTRAEMVGMGADMGVDMCAQICVDMCVDVGVKMRVDMCRRVQRHLCRHLWQQVLARCDCAGPSLYVGWQISHRVLSATSTPRHTCTAKTGRSTLLTAHQHRNFLLQERQQFDELICQSTRLYIGTALVHHYRHVNCKARREVTRAQRMHEGMSIHMALRTCVTSTSHHRHTLWSKTPKNSKC